MCGGVLVAALTEASGRARGPRGQWPSPPLIVVALVAAWRSRGDGRVPAFAGCLVVALLLFCLLIRWQPWHSRLQRPTLRPGRAAGRGLFERLNPALLAIALLLLAGSSVRFLTGNHAHPLVGRRAIFSRPWAEQRVGTPGRLSSGQHRVVMSTGCPRWDWCSAATIESTSSGASWRMPDGAAGSSRCSSGTHRRSSSRLQELDSSVRDRPERVAAGAPEGALMLGAQAYRSVWSREDIEVLVPAPLSRAE